MQLSDVDTFCAVYEVEENISDDQKKYMQQLIDWFRKKCDVEQMENFSSYIQILKIIRNIRTKNKEFQKSVKCTYLSFVKKPSLFDNFNELTELDELHVNVFKHDEEDIYIEKAENVRFVRDRK